MNVIGQVVFFIKNRLFSGRHAFEFYGFALLGIVCLSIIQMDKKSGSPSDLATLENNLVSAIEKKFAGSDDSEFIQYGIDISHYQGRFLGKLTELPNIDFVISKATEGISYIDSDFHFNWGRIQELGLIRGAYHFYISSDSPKKQASHYASVVGDLGENDLPPIIDVEDLSLYGSIDISALQKDLFIFLEALEKRYNKKPMIYSNYAFAQKYLDNSTFSKYPLWLAEYSGGKEPVVPTAWKEHGYKIWQKTDKYKLGDQVLDFDVFVGSKRELLSSN